MNVLVWWLGGNNCLMGCKKIGLVENSFIKLNWGTSIQHLRVVEGRSYSSTL